MADVLTLRFDMRAPSFGASTADLYGAAIEMCAWAETRGAALVVLSEHHGADDNHLPVPLVLASAIAARTTAISIMVAAVVLPLYEPVRLAEEISVLDIISRGRVSYVFGIGHRPEEYAHFGIDVRLRAGLADRNLAVVRSLLAGEAVDEGGRLARLAPPPVTPGGPALMIGGGSVGAARRAGRNGLALVAQADAPGMREAYEAACQAHGHEPRPGIFPDPEAPTAVFVADDVDQAWEELGPHLLHDATTAASYRQGQDGVASISRARTVDELRAGGPYCVVTTAEAAELVRIRGSVPLAPLCGGLPPAQAWPYLERAAEAVARASASG
jgi:alkanesulfonate monooxygenase SsuD/methylene tetrahydromethanopterin reductase-like flavin-dependent oxidoreductase (luciferase family)